MLNRNIALDAIKGLCITLMVFGHIAYIGVASEVLNSVKTFIYTFHMPIFLILSGFFFRFDIELKSKGLKLLRRVAVPYVFFISIYFFGLHLAAILGVQTTNLPPQGLVMYFYTIFIHPIGGYWFLHTLILVQLLTLVAKFISLQFSDYRDGYFLLFISVLLWFLMQYGVLDTRNVFYFFFGVLIARMSPEGLSLSFRVLLPIFVVLILNADLVKTEIYKPFSIGEVIWNILLFFLFWSAFEIKILQTYLSSLLAWLGRNTLIILVLHSLFIVLMKPLNTLFYKIDSSGILQVCMVTIITILGCLGSARILDKLKLSIYLFGVREVFSRRQSR